MDDLLDTSYAPGGNTCISWPVNVLCPKKTWPVLLKPASPHVPWDALRHETGLTTGLSVPPVSLRFWPNYQTLCLGFYIFLTVSARTTLVWSEDLGRWSYIKCLCKDKRYFYNKDIFISLNPENIHQILRIFQVLWLGQKEAWDIILPSPPPSRTSWPHKRVQIQK